MDYTIKNLRALDDVAVKHGFSEHQEARFANDDLDAEATGLAYHIVKPGKRQAFAHHHKESEEIHVILSGSGRVRLDDEIVDVRPLDAIRVAPNVTRIFEAGPDGLELVVFGPHKAGDAEIVQDFWTD